MSFQLKISERHQVVLILLAVLVLVVVGGVYLWPQIQKRADISRLRDELANSPIANVTKESLNDIARVEKEAAATLDRDWDVTAHRLTTLHNTLPNPSYIGYKVEHAAVLQRLNVKARNLEIKLPANLDISPAVTANEILRERLIQLRTVEKLVDLVIDQHINGIAAIRNLPTVLHYGADQKLICEEFPVEVSFSAYFPSLFYLFSSIFDEDRVFVFSKIRVTSDPREDDILHIKAVMSSLIFQ